MTARLDAITPLVPVSDVGAAVRFFEDVLGFSCSLRNDSYAFVGRDNAMIRLILAPPDADMRDPARQLSCYIDVTDIDALYASLKSALDKLPAGHVRAPFNQDYGQREFHVIFDALLIFFGEATGDTR